MVPRDVEEFHLQAVHTEALFTEPMYGMHDEPVLKSTPEWLQSSPMTPLCRPGPQTSSVALDSSSPFSTQKETAQNPLHTPSAAARPRVGSAQCRIAHALAFLLGSRASQIDAACTGYRSGEDCLVAD